RNACFSLVSISSASPPQRVRLIATLSPPASKGTISSEITGTRGPENTCAAPVPPSRTSLLLAARRATLRDEPRVGRRSRPLTCPSTETQPRPRVGVGDRPIPRRIGEEGRAGRAAVRRSPEGFWARAGGLT